MSRGSVRVDRANKIEADYSEVPLCGWVGIEDLGVVSRRMRFRFGRFRFGKGRRKYDANANEGRGTAEEGWSFRPNRSRCDR
jgi:hypothetical protein